MPIFIYNCIDAQADESYRKLMDTTFFSNRLGFEKNISVIVPFEWQDDVDNDFPLIIIFDRQNERSHQYILNAIDYMTSNYQMPPSIIISIEANRHRYIETVHQASDPDGMLKKNEQFLFEELIPLAGQRFHASPFRLFIGHSRYGFFTTALFVSKINDLNAVISLSPFFLQKNVNLVDSISRLEHLALNTTKYYRYVIGNDYPDQFQSMDSALQAMTNPRINTGGLFFEQGGHNATPGLAIAQFLYEIFEYWVAEQGKYLDDSNKKFSIIPELEKNISAHYGSELTFCIGILNGKGWYFFNEGKYGKAIRAWEILLEKYPNFSEAYLYIITAERELNLDSTNTIKKLRKSLKNSDFYTEDEKMEVLDELKF
jgi:enterochelin esterase-like enzyme